MVAAGGQLGLHLEGALVVGVSSWHQWEGGQPLSHFPVVVGTSSRVAELEHHGPAESDLPTGGEGRERSYHRRLGEPGKDAGIGEVPDARHLLVAAPGVFGLFEIEPAFLAGHCDELEPAPGVDHLAQRRIDRGAGARAARGATSSWKLATVSGCATRWPTPP